MSRLEKTFHTDAANILIAASSLAISARSNQVTLPLVISLKSKDAFPLRASISKSGTFAAYLEAIRNKMARSAPHRLYGFSVLSNAARLKAHGKMRPSFRTCFTTASEIGEASSLIEHLGLLRSIADNIEQMLVFSSPAAQSGNAAVLSLLHSAKYAGSNDAICLNDVISILGHLDTCPDERVEVLLQSLQYGREPGDYGAMVFATHPGRRIAWNSQLSWLG